MVKRMLPSMSCVGSSLASATPFAAAPSVPGERLASASGQQPTYCELMPCLPYDTWVLPFLELPKGDRIAFGEGALVHTLVATLVSAFLFPG